MKASFNVHAARITTLGERIDDVFLLSNHAGMPLSRDEQDTVRTLLKQEL
jgi:[protein-PII] uridylyltransferase